jgi:hypothetical protein
MVKLYSFVLTYAIDISEIFLKHIRLTSFLLTKQSERVFYTS